MKTVITINTIKYTIDLSKPLDISMSIRGSKDNANAWYIEEPKIEPAQIGEWTASVKEGASINFNNIQFNPHAHGTHTECVGHITEKFYSINKCLKTFFFRAEVITVAPEKIDEDYVISKSQLKFLLKQRKPEALVIRTMPNTKDKLSRQYSNTNWPYLTEDAAEFIKKIGVQHLLVDLPSVDKEKDDGKLLAHKAFWDVNGKIRKNATITEFIYVKNKIQDGKYILNLQIAPFENDATPSKPILYKIE
ncbi:kynurenine formamidase [Mesoflavibacter sabulilitoris]|uniref:Metal-dependent hydrolase n=1 Tax=Mesoflavibacter zeaxanthinifaciens subsp. sabulilitoris TaxID=1520893 RepID=A0A2T1N7D9_9FLAO|nr:cyclase family protein [Mesoflavibacter zeaxanthinifaciens]MBB3124050.1 kynurenine formamidase [Mesoflavibacter zeaxanthinifaciens subsp. sabulilitoris]PSG87776.1 metal-dependent hydrolase [Mesoflavibacter zeaxanthinifaciens subsp. sabulilitoris]